MKKQLLLLSLFFLQVTASNAQSNCNCLLQEQIEQDKQNNPAFDYTAALNKVKPQGTNACLGFFYELKAEQIMQLNDVDAAKTFLEKAATVYKQNKCGEENYYNYYLLLAGIYLQVGEYTQCADLSYKLLALSEKNKSYNHQIKSLLLLSQAFNKLNESSKGIIYARKAVLLLDKIESPLAQVKHTLNIASRFLWRYQDTNQKSLLDSAEIFTKLGLNIAQKNGYTNQLINAYNKMNGIAHERGDFKKAMLYVDSSLALAIEKNEISFLATSYGDKANNFMELKNYTEARRYADSSLKYNQLNKSPENIANAYALIYQICFRTENYEAALDAYSSYNTIMDSIKDVKKIKSINELEKKYSQAKNENTINELSKKKQLYLFLAIAGVLSAISIAFYLRQQALQHKKDILETEQRLNRARMNPHFFFNALTTLQKFALRDNDGQAMASNLSKFSNIMRETLESTYKDYVTIEQEMEFLNEYLEVQKIRFPETFAYTIKATNDLEVDDLLIPSMIIQPFIENSIEHGFVGIDYGGQIHINFSLVNNEIQIEIKDNGKGLATMPKETQHISRASQIIKDRIYLLNIKLKTKAGFSIANNLNENGVLVKIHLPIMYKENTVN